MAEEEVRMSEFSAMMTELKLSEQYFPLLASNGFDEWISIAELDEGALKDIGVKNQIDREQILACVHAAKAIKPEDIPKSALTTGKSKVKLATSSDFNYTQSNFPTPVPAQNDNESTQGVPIPPGHFSEDGEEDEQPRDDESEFVESDKTIQLTVAKVQKYSYKKINKDEEKEHFFRRILHLYVKQEELTRIVCCYLSRPTSSIFLYSESLISLLINYILCKVLSHFAT